MDALQIELARMAKGATLGQSIEDVDKILEQLVAAREAIANGMEAACGSMQQLNLVSCFLLHC